MALNYKQAVILKTTIPALQEHGERLTSIFYSNMLKDHPELNHYFNTVNLENGRQPRALTAVILKYAANISNLSELTPQLERMCNKHCSLGIQPQHYGIVGEYLIQAFAEVLGATMTPDVKVAWVKAYDILAKMLIGRERQLYKGFEKWTGWRKFRIERKVAESENIVSFYLAPQDKKNLVSFLPGQYISVQLDVPSIGYLQSRQYSLSDAPRSDHYRITIKKEEGICNLADAKRSYIHPGLISNILIDEMKPGDVVDVSHPVGEFYLDISNSSSVPLVLISAGVGAAPLVSILNTVVESGSTRPISWIHGAHGNVPFGHHISQIAKKCPNFRTNIFKTELAESDITGVDYDYDFRMDLSKVSREDLYISHSGTEYFICGPEQFMVEMADYLEDQEVNAKRIKFELFSTGDLTFN